VPLDLDFLTQIINVHWGGGAVFVFGGLEEDDGQGNIYCATVNEGDPEIQKILMPRSFEPIGSSYHLVGDDDTATFLMCGNEFEMIDTTDDVGNPVRFVRFFSMIYISNDGLHWRKAREQAGTGNPFQHETTTSANPMGLVWNETRQSFYYDQLNTAGTSLSDQILSSSDGADWGMVSSADVTGVDPLTYRSTFPDTYCVDNDCLDELDQHVPDGVMDSDGDEDNGVTMQPEKPPLSFYAQGTHSFNFSSSGETYGSNKVQIKIVETDETGHKTTTNSTKVIPGVAKVMCVAGVNDIWMAGGFKGLDFDGGGSIAMSVDRGQTWTSVINTPQPILTMSAGQVEAP
jgi:hypothetical protein